MKRFWTQAESVAGEGGWAIELDGRPLRTPGRAPLIVPGEALAFAIATEWNDAGDAVDPRAMPLTGLANRALFGDRVEHLLQRRAGLPVWSEVSARCDAPPAAPQGPPAMLFAAGDYTATRSSRASGPGVSINRSLPRRLATSRVK